MCKMQRVSLPESSARFGGLRPEDMRHVWDYLRGVREVGDPRRGCGLRHLQKGSLRRLREGMSRLQEKGLSISRGDL